MTAAASVLPVDRMSDWLQELERILKSFDALPSAAQDAINSVVESLVRDPNTSDAEISRLNALLTLDRTRTDDGQHQRRASRSQKRAHYAHRISLALSKSS